MVNPIQSKPQVTSLPRFICDTYIYSVIYEPDNMDNKKHGTMRRNTLHDIRDQYMKLEEARLLHETLRHIDNMSKSTYTIPSYNRRTSPQSANHIDHWLNTQPTTEPVSHDLTECEELFL